MTKPTYWDHDGPRTMHDVSDYRAVLEDLANAAERSLDNIVGAVAYDLAKKIDAARDVLKQSE